MRFLFTFSIIALGTIALNVRLSTIFPATVAPGTLYVTRLTHTGGQNMLIRQGICSLTALAGSAALARTATAAPGDGFYGEHMIYGGWFMGPFMMLVALGLIIVAIVVVSRLFGSGSSAGSALRILEERFARGEIDREEFEDRKKALSR